MKIWTLEETCPTSGRTIYAREVPEGRGGTSGTYDFAMEREFQVRTAESEVLLQVSDTAKGEYWCGVFLFFVDGSHGRRVRLDASNTPKDRFFDVPDVALPAEKLWS